MLFFDCESLFVVEQRMWTIKCCVRSSWPRRTLMSSRSPLRISTTLSLSLVSLYTISLVFVLNVLTFAFDLLRHSQWSHIVLTCFFMIRCGPNSSWSSGILTCDEHVAHATRWPPCARLHWPAWGARAAPLTHHVPLDTHGLCARVQRKSGEIIPRVVNHNDCTFMPSIENHTMRLIPINYAFLDQRSHFQFTLWRTCDFACLDCVCECEWEEQGDWACRPCGPIRHLDRPLHILSHVAWKHKVIPCGFFFFVWFFYLLNNYSFFSFLLSIVIDFVAFFFFVDL